MPMLQLLIVQIRRVNINTRMYVCIGNLVGQIVERMQNKSKNEAIDLLIPGTNLVLYSGVSSVCVFDNVIA